MTRKERLGPIPILIWYLAYQWSRVRALTSRAKSEKIDAALQYISLFQGCRGFGTVVPLIPVSPARLSSIVCGFLPVADSANGLYLQGYENGPTGAPARSPSRNFEVCMNPEVGTIILVGD